MRSTDWTRDRPPRRRRNEERTVSGRELLEWNGVLPELRVVEEEHGATPTFMVVADYGWCERILCGGCYVDDAETIVAALNEAKADHA